MAVATPNLTVQNWFETTLSASISSSSTTISMNSIPTGVEGYLVIEPDSSNNREVIYFTSKTGSAVVCPSVAAGRGVDGTTAQSHSSGATVRMEITSSYWRALQDMSAVTAGAVGAIPFATGWTPISGESPDTVTANGNNSFDLVFNGIDLTSYISNGMKLRLTRTVAAPNTAFSLDGTNDYYVKTSPNKLTFTDDFVCSAWVYMTSYSGGIIASRYNGTSGWSFKTETDGRLTIAGYNAGAGNISYCISYQSVPLNRWVHVAAQLDMSTFTATTTTSYIMIDGVDVPAQVARSGTNPTALVQAGNLEIGSQNGGTLPFPGYIDQVAVYSAKVTQATILASINRALSGAETSLASAYSNGSVNDLNTTTPNNLTATNGATTVANSPFGNRGASTTLEYGVVMANSFSTNTTVTVQVPEGCQLPTTGGITTIDYSTQNVPYGFPRDRSRWDITMVAASSPTQACVAGTWYNLSSLKTIAPIGSWKGSYRLIIQGSAGGPTTTIVSATLSTSSSSESNYYATTGSVGVSITTLADTFYVDDIPISVATATPYYLLSRSFTGGGSTTIQYNGNIGGQLILLKNNYI